MNDVQLLFHRFHAGDKEAGDELIEKHLGLVLAYVKTITGNDAFSDLREDLVQSGIEGLITARDRFELNQGNQFSTYAYHWIRKFVMKTIDHRVRFYDLHQLINEANTETEGDELSTLLDEKFGYYDRLADYRILWSDLEKILTQREFDICRLLKQGYTMTEIGEIYKVSRQRIHQLVESARSKIQHYLNGN